MMLKRYKQTWNGGCFFVTLEDGREVFCPTNRGKYFGKQTCYLIVNEAERAQAKQYRKRQRNNALFGIFLGIVVLILGIVVLVRVFMLRPYQSFDDLWFFVFCILPISLNLLTDIPHKIFPPKSLKDLTQIEINHILHDSSSDG